MSTRPLTESEISTVLRHKPPLVRSPHPPSLRHRKYLYRLRHGDRLEDEIRRTEEKLMLLWEIRDERR